MWEELLRRLVVIAGVQHDGAGTAMESPGEKVPETLYARGSAPLLLPAVARPVMALRRSGCPPSALPGDESAGPWRAQAAASSSPLRAAKICPL